MHDILSVVEKPFLNSDWFLEIISVDKKGQSTINYRCKKATYYSNNTSQLKQKFL